LVALGFITFLHVVFGEMIPKALALGAPEATTLRVNPLMRTFSIVFRPAVAFLSWLAMSLMRLLGIREPDSSESLYSAQELAIATEESTAGGQLLAPQRDIIRSIFDLERHTAAELMTSRAHIVVALIEASSTSRYPVFVNDLDHVIGLLHVKDFVRFTQSKNRFDLETLVRDLPTVGSATPADALLDRFKSERVHAALVVNELGSTIGLVTLDDVISEVIDDPAGHGDLPAIIHDDGSITLDGETTLAELLEDHGFRFEHADVTTLAGLVLTETGTVPNAGDRVEAQGVELTVETVDGHKLTQVRVRRLDGAAD
jgi:CBS domain containing-hemolysin-like protein